MRSCRSLGEMCNRQRNRLTCSQSPSTRSPFPIPMPLPLVTNPCLGSSSRQRVTPSSALQGRSVDSVDGHSVDSGQGIVMAGAVLKDRSEGLSDASDLSDGYHLVFEHNEGTKPEEETRSPAVPIPGQLTEAFAKLGPPSWNQGYARSAPVPVPNAALRSPRLPRMPLYETDAFIPPHLLTERSEQESFRRERLGCRGLSSLRARNAVLARLARVGYIDGLTEMTESLPIDAASSNTGH